MGRLPRLFHRSRRNRSQPFGRSPKARGTSLFDALSVMSAFLPAHVTAPSRVVQISTSITSTPLRFNGPSEMQPWRGFDCLVGRAQILAVAGNMGSGSGENGGRPRASHPRDNARRPRVIRVRIDLPGNPILSSGAPRSRPPRVVELARISARAAARFPTSRRCSVLFVRSAASSRTRSAPARGLR
jgi:hypothetical protein